MGFYDKNNFEHEARSHLMEQFSNIKIYEIERLWKSIKDFIKENPQIQVDDILNTLERLEKHHAFSVEKTEEKLEINHEDLDELVEALEEAIEDETHEKNKDNEIEKINIKADKSLFDQTDNYLQDDLATVILHDINEIANEARSQALIDSLGGMSSIDSYRLDLMIAIAPHQVIKGSLKAMYHHIGGMYQNLVLGSEIYPDEACFTGAVKDAIADNEHLHGHEPWQVKFSPYMDSHKPQP